VKKAKSVLYSRGLIAAGSERIPLCSPPHPPHFAVNGQHERKRRTRTQLDRLRLARRRYRFDGLRAPRWLCVEEGTVVVQPEGTIEELLPCSEWVNISVDGCKPLVMHPDTLVSVFKKASELTVDDRIEVMGARWQKFDTITHSYREGTKVKRTCPGGTYHAGDKLVRLHNAKVSLNNV
jgi:hypothetical protein